MKISNKKAPSSFNVIERIEAGIALLGSEVKALRAGHANLSGSYAKIIGSEVYLVNAKIFPYEYSRLENYQEDRTRKLLLHKKEILSLKSKLDQGSFTLIPTFIYEKNGNFKIEVALAKGKKKGERRRDSKRQALARAAEQDIKKFR